MANRLAGETSPYLLQHKDNPVDWFPWGDEALTKAKAEDKPILLSVGYAACHWCHVMEHESFEDPHTAALMNSNFVPIKVDREERPDIDAIYMEAVQAMTGHGGWPMTVFLTPDGKPFYGGTYFPPVQRHGLPAFPALLEAIDSTWRERRDEVEKQGRTLVDHISPLARGAGEIAEPDPSVLDDAAAALQRTFDPAYGGFGGAPKFPQPSALDLLLRIGNAGNDDATEMVTKTLDAMASGGIFDQIGGGFHRYATDAAWVVPHFEKMLYDNAQLFRTYARAWRATRNDRYREVALATATWMLGEMRDPGGGFWSALDADSEGVEGRYYVWSYAEFAEAVGVDLETAARKWGATESGNFDGQNILVDAAPNEPAPDRATESLLALRGTRVRPGTDSKVLTSWNALAASAFAEAGVLLDRPELVDVGVEIMTFITNVLRADGRLMRSYRDGIVKHLGYAEDYAYFLEASLALFEATHDPDWIDEARWAADEAMRLFGAEDGGFYTTGADAERLITRAKDIIDGAMASANSVIALELQRLALITGESKYEDAALRTIQLLGNAVGRSPLGFPHMIDAIGFYVSQPKEVVIVRRGSDEAARSLLAAVHDANVGYKVLVVGSPDQPGIPLLEGRVQLDDKATAYVCLRGECRLPVTDPGGLSRQLSAS